MTLWGRPTGAPITLSCRSMFYPVFPGTAAWCVDEKSPVSDALDSLSAAAAPIVDRDDLLPVAGCGSAWQSSFYLEDPFGFGSTFCRNGQFRRYRHLHRLRTGRALHSGVHLLRNVSFPRHCVAPCGQGGQDSARASTYKTLLMWVYAVAPPVAGLIGVLLFDQHVGPIVDSSPCSGWQMQIGVKLYRYQHCHDRYLGLETGSGQLHLLPVRPSGHFQVGSGSGQHRLPVRYTPVLDGDLSVARTDRLLPADHQHHLRVLRHLRDHRCDREERAGATTR